MINTLNFARRALRGGTALQALALVGAGVGMAGLTAPAAAQDYTSGAIGGTVRDEAGNPVDGATVTITSRSQGFTRTVTTNSGGVFLINGLAPGGYDVSVQSSAGAGYKADNVPLSSSQTAQLNVQLAAAGGDDIVVTGTRAVASFSGATTGLNVNVADFIKDKPLGRDLTSVILLAPGTAAGDAAFGNLPSIGGSSVAENAYFVNGLNTTNFDTGLGSTAVPFYFYQSVETKVGGYPAEYGRATGGIINATTKSGTNDFMAAIHVDWAPNFLVSRGKDRQSYTGVNVNGSLYQNNTDEANRRSDSLLVNIEAGGPIIKDRLFFYGLAQMRKVTSRSNSPLATGITGQGTSFNYRDTDPFWGIKVDAFPISSQHLEFTMYDTRATQERSDQPYSYGNGANIYNTATAVTGFKSGGLNFVGKYTGRMTDFLTVSAAYGRVRDRFDQVSLAGAGNLPYILNSSGGVVNGIANGGLLNAQQNLGTDAPYNTERKFFRADADILVTFLGTHHFRGGYDQETNTLNHVNVRNGGAYELSKGAITQAAYNAVLGNGGLAYILRPNGQVEVNYFNTGGTFGAKNKAYYIQDEWKPFDRLTLTLGARRDDFRVDKPSGAPIAILNKNYAPRLSAEYQLFGDKSGKIYGSYGWYFLPIASNTGFRQGAPSYYLRQRYQYLGLDSSGIPILGNINTAYASGTCPIQLVPGKPTTNCNVTGDGSDINTTQAISSNLKATKETEIIVGYQQKVGLWTFGLSYTNRKLNRTSEDSAIDAAVNAYCAANNIRATPVGGGASVPCSAIWDGFHQYVINNPGSPITVNLLANGYDINNRTVSFTAAQLGYGKAKRTYDAVTFSFDRASNGRYSLGGSYTWSKSKGNIEGGVQSDFGQSDTGITQDFDQPGFVTGAYGYLPNDRRHEFKLYGSVNLNDDFTIGMNTQVFSQRPLSCFGYNPTDAFANGYDAASHYCNLVLSPRGTAQKSDWYETINTSFRYNVHFADRVVTLRADVFNLLNSQAVLKRNEIGDLTGSNVNNAAGLPISVDRNPNYGLVTSYQAPRFVRLGVDIAF